MIRVVAALHNCGWHYTILAFPRGRSPGTRNLINAAGLHDLNVTVTELPE